MIPVAQVKKDLLYSQNLKDVIDVLKLISSSEFNRLSSNMPQEDVLKEHIISCFGLLRSVSKHNAFLVEKEKLPPAFLLISSDEGFLGEVNTCVVNAAITRGLKKNARFIVLGERGEQMLKDSGVEYTFFPALENDIKMDRIAEISNYVMDLYRKKEIGAFYIVYMKFKSFTSHNIEVAKMLPCDELLSHAREEKKDHSDTLVEPGPYFITEYLVKLWLESSMYHIFWSSKLSEWSIRVMRLEHSSDELKEITQNLKFKYFKSVHALSDKVIREIFAARMATQNT